MFERFFRNRYGYSRWDGTQRIEGLDADDILNALSDDYLENGNLQQALRRLMQEGVRTDDGQRTMGLRELLERLRNQRNQQLSRYNMASGVMDDLRQKLEEIKQLERQGIQRRLDEHGQPPSQQGQQPGEQGDQPGQQNQQGQQARRQQQSGQSGQAGQMSQSGQSQQGQQGEAGGSGDDLSPEQMRKMLEMIAKRKQEYLDNCRKIFPDRSKASLNMTLWMTRRARNSRNC